MIVALAVVAIVVVALAVSTGLQRKPRQAGNDAVYPSDLVVVAHPGQRVCMNARVPEHTGAVEIPVVAGPPVGGMRLTIEAGGRVLATSGPDSRRVARARFVLDRTLTSDVAAAVCVNDVSRDAAYTLLGSLSQTGLSVNNRPRQGGLTIAFMRPGSETNFAMIPVVAERIGLTREWLAGPARAVVIVILVLAAIALTVALLAGRRRGTALACATVAVANALAWSLLVPVWQIPDEPFHVSYVQDLAVKHHAPRPKDSPSLSPELNLIAGASSLGVINFNPVGRPIWTRQAADEWQRQLDANPSQRNPGSFANVVDYPPLYYATLVPAYAATHALGGSTLAAMTTMRATSALYAGITVFAIFALLLELFPGRRRLATAVTLLCAYQPVFVWISGGVNPDGALIALGTVMFWLFARGFRRGLTAWLAVGLTLTMVAAYLVQLRGLGLGPGWAAGMLLLLWRRVPGGWRARVRPLGAALAAAAVPLAVYVLLNVAVWDRPLIPGGVKAAASGTLVAAPAAPTSGFLSFLWQYFAPPIGSMTDFFHLSWTVTDLWVPMWVGKFGWYDYQFPATVNTVAFWLYAVVAVAAIAALVPILRRQPTARLLTLVYALLAAGVVYAIARVAYPLRRAGDSIFEQARYFMPLISLYAIAFALAARWLRRFAVPALSVLVGASIIQLLAAFELTVQRYYL